MKNFFFKCFNPTESALPEIKPAQSTSQAVIDIDLPNAPLNEIHPMNAGNKRSASNTASVHSSKPVAAGNSNANRPSKHGGGSRSSKPQSSSSVNRIKTQKPREHADSMEIELRELNELVESNSLGDSQDFAKNQNIISSLDDKFNSDIYDTNN